MRFRAVLGVYLIILTSCGLGPEGGDKGITSPATLYLFSAPWCTPCTEELRALDRAVATELSAEARERLTIKVWVTSANLPSKPPTETVVAEYKDKLGISLPMQADPWKWTTYLQYYPEGAGVVPGAVILRPGSEPQAIRLGTKPDIIFGNLKAALGEK